MGSPHSAFWRALDHLDAPWFSPLPCGTCRAEPGDYCTRGRVACQSRVDAAIKEANRLVQAGEV